MGVHGSSSTPGLGVSTERATTHPLLSRLQEQRAESQAYTPVPVLALSVRLKEM
jgi:hypothetical protein